MTETRIQPIDSSRLALVAALAFGFGACLSIGLVYQRVSGGDVGGTTAVRAATVALALAFVRGTRSLIEPRRRVTYFVAQLVAPLAAMLLVHAALTLSPWARPDGSLREGAAQLVNDLVEIVCLLLLAWSFVAERPIARRLAPALAFVILCTYMATASRWHVDVGEFPHLTTQQFVRSQIFCTAGVLLFLHFICFERPLR